MRAKKHETTKLLFYKEETLGMLKLLRDVPTLLRNSVELNKLMILSYHYIIPSYNYFFFILIAMFSLVDNFL